MDFGATGQLLGRLVRGGSWPIRDGRAGMGTCATTHPGADPLVLRTSLSVFGISPSHSAPSIKARASRCRRGAFSSSPRTGSWHFVFRSKSAPRGAKFNEVVLRIFYEVRRPLPLGRRRRRQVFSARDPGFANVAERPRLCKNASAGRGAEKSTAQIALYSTIVTYGGVRGPLKSFPKCVFTRPRPIPVARGSTPIG